MGLSEIKIEIPPAGALMADEALLEAGRENWSVLEDVIVRRAWLVGLGGDAAALRAEWADVQQSLGTAGIAPVSEPAA